MSCADQDFTNQILIEMREAGSKKSSAPVVDIILHQPVLHRQPACEDHSHKTTVLLIFASKAGRGKVQVRSRIALLTMAVLR